MSQKSKRYRSTKMWHLKTRIKQVAVALCPDYPNINTVDEIEQFFAIEQVCRGTEDANKDLHKLIDLMRCELGWTKLQTVEFWEKNKEKI